MSQPQIKKSQLTQPQTMPCATATNKTLAEQLLHLINQQPNITVSLEELDNQLQTIAASDVSLQISDFSHVSNTFNEQLNQHYGEFFHLNINTFFSLTLLHKIGVLSDTLHHSEAFDHIKSQLNNLKQALVFAPMPAQSNKPPRRRASLHRANLQLNKKRNPTQTNNSSINCLHQCSQDLQHWEHNLLAHMIEACNKLLSFAPADFNRAIERLIALHHHWRLLLQNHLKRLQVWLFEQLQLKNLTLASQNTNGHEIRHQTTQCVEQLRHNGQTFSEQFNAYQTLNAHTCTHSHTPFNAPCVVSYHNYLISRHHIQLLLAQSKLSHSAAPLLTNRVLTNRVFVLFEPNHQLADKLCYLLSLHQKLIDLFWYDICHLSESICQLDTDPFNHQVLQCFYQAQNFKNHLVNVSTGIENLANQLHFSAAEVLTALSRTQHHLFNLVDYQARILTENTATIGKITIHHSEKRQFAQLTQVEYPAALVELVQTFDDIVAAISYRQHKSLDHIQLCQVQKVAKINLDTLNQSMDNDYNNWLQLLNLLRGNDVKQILNKSNK